jgi:hypothetical protein
MEQLLTRDEFRTQVFARDDGRCVICKKLGTAAHHIIERKLWSDGGYYLDNGVTLCDPHHIEAEDGTLSCEDIRKAAGITNVCTPDDFDSSKTYNKWGQQIHKYPRTQHIEGSAIQDGDEDLDRVPFEQIKGRHIVVEEKIDGANSGISFSPNYELLLQSRGHYLTGGPRERHFNLLKQWASVHESKLLDILEDKYVMYGEWMYAKHTEFYDHLPHYFMEFDILNVKTGEFLSTPRRWKMLEGLSVSSVLVLFQGELQSVDELLTFLGPSRFKTEHHDENLELQAHKANCDVERVKNETDCSPLMEGLYIKVEEDGVVKERYKYVRSDFLQRIKASDSHWLERPIIPNILAPNVDIYS